MPKLPSVAGIKTFWRLRAVDQNGEMVFFSGKDRAPDRTTEDSLIWKNQNGPEVKLTRESAGNWRIGFSDCPENLSIREIQFPVWDVTDPELKMLLPLAMGYATGPVKDWRPGEHWVRFYSFQMAACMGKNRNMLVMFPDREHYTKNMLINKGEDGSCEVACIFYVPQQETPVKSCQLPYPAVFHYFTGSWFNAAAYYRKWAHKQEFYKRAMAKKNPLREVAMWFWNRGGADEIGDPAIKFTDKLKLPTAMDWYWWHNNPYDTDFPYYWPPREGVEKFRAKIKEMKEHGIFTQVYTNGMTWDMDNPGWADGGDESVLIRENQTPIYGVYNRFTKHRLALLCSECEPFVKEMMHQAEELRNAGLDGLYLDMVGCASNANPCWNPAHHHTKGGGKYLVAGYRDYLERLHKHCPELSLSTEECTEPYMDIFDSMIVLCTSTERTGWGEAYAGEYVPAYQAIYHGNAALFGTYAIPDSIPPWDSLWPDTDRWPADEEKDWVTLYPDQFYLDIARIVINGMQPSVHCLRNEHLEDPRFKEIMDFLYHTAEFYHKHLDWLFDGEMMDPGSIKVKNIKLDCLTRTVYTVPATSRSRTFTRPAVLHSVWKSKNGKVMLFAINYTSKKQTF